MGADPEQGRAVLDEAPGVRGVGLRPGKSSKNFGDRTLATREHEVFHESTRRGEAGEGQAAGRESGGGKGRGGSSAPVPRTATGEAGAETRADEPTLER